MVLPYAVLTVEQVAEITGTDMLPVSFVFHGYTYERWTDVDGVLRFRRGR